MTTRREHAEAILTATGISKRFGGVTALDAVGFELRAGEIHALMGENGAGKSTLMKILSGAQARYDGTIRLGARAVRFASVRQAEAAGIAIIHQELNLVPELTAAENIFLGREPRIAGLIIDRRAGARATRAILGGLGIDLDPDARVSTLSVGEQQLVEIAKALSLSARILIMDEPTSALSPAECARLFAIIRQLSAQGVAVVYISHRINEVLHLADRVTVLRDGRHVLTKDMQDLDAAAIIAAMVGRELVDIRQGDRAASDEVVLSVRNLCLSQSNRHGWRKVIDAVNFDVHAGEILGIGGLLGSGRTQILETIFGAARGRKRGTILIDGRPVEISSPRSARRFGIAFVTEDRKATGLNLAASIVDNIALPLVGRLARFAVRALRSEARIGKHMVKTLGIKCASIAQPVASLSGGNQQKTLIGKWLATKPRILLLDEPTRGIDVGAKRDIYQVIFTLARQGLAIVVVSSELPELLLLADRILVMSEGRQAGVVRRAMASEEGIMQLAAPRGAVTSGAATWGR